jgi:hypothetical protein
MNRVVLSSVPVPSLAEPNRNTLSKPYALFVLDASRPARTDKNCLETAHRQLSAANLPFLQIAKNKRLD